MYNIAERYHEHLVMKLYKYKISIMKTNIVSLMYLDNAEAFGQSYNTST